jgi:hypothetical protein
MRRTQPIVVRLTRREGEHGEWNMVRAINQKRFDAGNKGGLAARLGVMFDSYPRRQASLTRRSPRATFTRAYGRQLIAVERLTTSHSFSLRQSDRGSALMNPTLLCP